MPLFVPLSLNSTFSSKSLTVPPLHIRKLLTLTTFSGVVSPTISPFSTRQKVGSPSQSFRALPSKIGTNPELSSGFVGRINAAGLCIRGRRYLRRRQLHQKTKRGRKKSD